MSSDENAQKSSIKKSSATPVTIRAEFEDLIVKDLYGPAGGEYEQLSDFSPSERYLVGMLAPVQPLGAATGGERTNPDDSNDRDPLDSKDGALPEEPAAKPSLFPSSKGFSFAVPATTTAITVTATWGQYTREEAGTEPPPDQDDQLKGELQDAADHNDSGGQADGASPGLVWQRSPAGGSVRLPLPSDGGEISALSLDPNSPGVTVSGRANRYGGALLVSLFLVNDQEPQKRLKDERWLFQAEFSVTADPETNIDQDVTGEPIFIGRDSVLNRRQLIGGAGERDELAQLEMMYRHQIEFSVGHGTAVHADVDPIDPTHAWRVSTRSIPRYEVPRTDPPSPGEPGFGGLSETVFDMQTLAQAADTDLRAMLEPLVDGYRFWLDRQAQRVVSEPDLHDHQAAGEKSIQDARLIADRLAESLAVLDSDQDARDAFRFANQTMWQQRIRTIAAGLVRSGDQDDLDSAISLADVPKNRSWRPFQIAFLLLNLPSLTDPRHSERTDAALVDLLFFPTGGGKTEAYLGMTAYTFAIRRLQGDRFGRDGSDGVAVLMRYTLRLLTAQQFQRASALVAACEVRRRELMSTDERWAGAPFRIGLWVGSTVTPNIAKFANEQVVRVKNSGFAGSGRSTPLQLTVCPWCGRELSLALDVKPDSVRHRTITYCSDALGECPFTAAGEAATGVTGEGIPVVTIDEEIYRLLPSLVIATADKFAQLPWQGALHLLFGSVTTKCTRHGYRSPDLDTAGGWEERDSHPVRNPWPRAHTVPVEPLRPPDLIIQDELHLISGPLGSLTGLYETVIDDLATWDVDGVACRPKVIASTATVRRAADQVHNLFARRLAVFPPPMLDVENNFFSVQRATRPDPNDSTTPWAPGRLYLGICGFGSRLKSVQTRVFITLLAAGKRLFDRYGEQADAYLTMVGYYNALRELAGGRRLIDDDVRSRLARASDRGLGRRTLRIVEELTSRKASTDIPATLDQLGQKFLEAGEVDYASHRSRAGAPATKGLADDYRPIDVLLATNMISVGVDVPRLGLMVTVGQPKATSEYIQATSRVGRSADGPGIVLTLYNWARPRDLSHYESFEHYHATFYKHVEALSVTPFAPRAVDRGLTALVVALVRHSEFGSGGEDWNPEPGAQTVPAQSSAVEDALRPIVERVEYVTGDPAISADIMHHTNFRQDSWVKRQAKAAQEGAGLTYKGRQADTQALLDSPVPGRWGPWSAPMSLRETEANVNLLVDLWDNSLSDQPPFRTAESNDTPQPGQSGTETDDPPPESPPHQQANEVDPTATTHEQED